MIIFQWHIFASDRIRIKNHEQNLGVSKNSGIPKWMEKIMEHPVKMDDLGVPLFSETSIWRSKKDTGKLKKPSHSHGIDVTLIRVIERDHTKHHSFNQQIQDTLRWKKDHPTKKNKGQHLLPKTLRDTVDGKKPRVFQLILVICTGFLLVGPKILLMIMSDMPLAAPKMYQKGPRNVTETPARIGDIWPNFELV